MLSRIFGECPQVKLIDFLVAHPWSEFSKTELAEGAQITRPTIYKLLDKLLAENLVIKTKKTGNIQLYQTNRNSPVIKHISSLQGFLADMELEKEKKSFKEGNIELPDEKLDEMLGLSKEKIKMKELNEDKIHPNMVKIVKKV
ncbi:winged helix-turn-helix domain-containing protein [Methanobacterium formicicum]|jgi:DNA-binding GntR family transcriptional regulator|uniref:HTH arsR-type domain-containing protein n=1 Tax=Methanobacterium formicicum TaxID=2162 RepID=A0A0S4FP07_METFO|nr:winged helix-turn-helix domain-containing protein [Methanobacterium formicicum]CEL24814.1 hypothetical protein MB9_1176 [Methanobacterium formicicum]